MTSPLVVVQNQTGPFLEASPNGINATPGNTIRVRLLDDADVSSWSLTVFGLDDLSSAPVLTLAAGLPREYSFAFPNALGRAVLLYSVVNEGRDRNGVTQQSYGTTVGIWSLTGDGKRVLAVNQSFEGSIYGWISDWNSFVRNPTAGGLPSLPGSDGYWALKTLASVGSWVPLTSDIVSPGLTHSLSFATGSGAVEVGATGIDPTFNHVPALNSGGLLTAATITDATGGSPSSRLGSANGFHGAGSPPYTAPSTPGSMTWTCAFTYNGIAYTDTVTKAVDNRLFGIGVITGAGATAITASGTGATVSGGTASGTLAGSLVTTPVGQSSSPSPSSQKLVFACAHSATAHVVHDANGDLIPFTRTVSSYSYTTVTGVIGVLYDIYESDNLLTLLALPLTIVS